MGSTSQSILEVIVSRIKLDHAFGLLHTDTRNHHQNMKIFTKRGIDGDIVSSMYNSAFAGRLVQTIDGSMEIVNSQIWIPN